MCICNVGTITEKLKQSALTARSWRHLSNCKNAIHIERQSNGVTTRVVGFLEKFSGKFFENFLSNFLSYQINKVL